MSQWENLVTIGSLHRAALRLAQYVCAPLVTGFSHHRQNSAGARSGRSWSPYVPSCFRLQRDSIESPLITTTANHYTSFCMYYCNILFKNDDIIRIILGKYA